MPPRWIKIRFSGIPWWIKKPRDTQSEKNLIMLFIFILAVHSFGIGRELIHPRKDSDHTERSILKLFKHLHRSRLLHHFFHTHSYVMNHRLWVTKNISKICKNLFSVHPGTTPGRELYILIHCVERKSCDNVVSVILFVLVNCCWRSWLCCCCYCCKGCCCRGLIECYYRRVRRTEI